MGAIETLIDIMELADAIHCYGFGRSRHAATSLAVRLRHFQRVLPDVWSVGDQVRNPFEPGQLLISFSREGRRFELEKLVEFARDNDPTCAFVTGEPGPDGKNVERTLAGWPGTARSSSSSRPLRVPTLSPPPSTAAVTLNWPPTSSRRPWCRASVSGAPSPLRMYLEITSTDRSDRLPSSLP